MNTPISLPAIFVTGKSVWASVIDLNTTYDPCWTIDVEVDDESRAVVEGAGLKIVSGKLDKEGNVRPDFITIKRKHLKNDGSERVAPTVKDSQNLAWDNKYIGNGSLVCVRAQPYDWYHPPSKNSGRSADLTAVQVIELVEYNQGSSDDFAVVPGGYVAEVVAEDIPFAS
tara:strand:- start:23 stop:532 length:510 start_codon:yes stop_codon:yes gene_type:complete